MAFNLDRSLCDRSSDGSFSTFGNEEEKYRENPTTNNLNHALRTMSKLSEFLKENILCDVTFVCTDGQTQQKFPAHRLVMATLSDYFRAMFESNMVETRQHEISINDVNPNAFEKLITYAYKGSAQKSRSKSFIHFSSTLNYLNLISFFSGCLDIDQDNVTDILSAAHLFDISEVVETCSTFIEKQLHPSNALGIHKFALQRHLSSLITKAWNFILVRCSFISNSVNFETEKLFFSGPFLTDHPE